MNIEIISASAGSGKTYRLAGLLETAVRDESVRPDAILATTFTIRAAAELQERVRTRLLSGGLATQAQQLSASRIGTVNSVCGSLLKDFAFDLGMSPEQQVLEEGAVAGVIKKVMAEVIDSEVSSEIYRFQQRFQELDIREDIKSIIGKARANGLSVDELEVCAKRSAEEFAALLGTATADGESLNKQLKVAMNAFLSLVDTEHDTTQTTRDALEVVRRLRGRMYYQKYLPWSDWRRLAKLKVAKKSQEMAKPLIDAAECHDCHPQLRDDAQRLIALTFMLAAKVLAAYQEYKRQWGVVDFIDQEVLALKLLQMEGPAEIIKDHLDLVLVDEFQDTSPIQLAIFLRLAALAKRSVWVGDQKQAIYGFRDADPALMDVAIASILGGDEPETLEFSWRSRPELVRSTSNIFTTAFAGHGFSEGRVRLEPAPEKEKEVPEGLGPVYECWSLDSKNQGNDALALAGAMRDYLRDENASIRDTKTGARRQVLGGDIAILCRTNTVCVAVAEALEQQGISAAVPRPGLLACPEVILVLAVMRLLVDPADSLARAEVARLLDNPEDHNGWLQKALAAKYGKGFDLALFSMVEKERPLLQAAGPLEVLDVAMRIADIRKYCCAWGNAEDRLANLDSLRALSAAYIQGCSDSSKGVGPTGLLAYLDGLDGDTRAVVQGKDTVQVVTWHGAKGLEWPVTVLFQLDKSYKPLPLGVNVVSDADFTLEDPLARRWLRFWPNPYGNFKTGAPFHERLEENGATYAHRERELRQELRLLYVGWTRARDIVVLAGRPGFLQKGILRLLQHGDGEHLLEPPKDQEACWAGAEVKIKERWAKPLAPQERRRKAGIHYIAAGGVEYPPAYQAASSVAAQGTVVTEERLGERLHLKGNADMQMVGEAVHSFLGADNRGSATEKRLRMAEDIVGRWKTGENMNPKDLLRAGDRLHEYVEKRWPLAKWHREYPVFFKNHEGTIVSGFIDLLLETEDGYIIIDHKSFPGRIADVRDKAAGYAGQLGMYSDALSHAGGKKVLALYIHLPVVGLMIEVVEASNSIVGSGETYNGTKTCSG